MNREDRALEAYIQAVLPERERWLYQHAPNKVRVITRSVNPAEKAEYLNSDAFQNTLRQLQRRDRIWQGLLRGELVLSGDRAEFDRLRRMIDEEIKAGRKIDLAFLRTVEKSRVPLAKAYEARRIIREACYNICGNIKPGYDIVFVARTKTAFAKSTDIEKCMRLHLQKAGII